MIPNLPNTSAGLVLVHGEVEHPTRVEGRYLPFAAFAVISLTLAV